MPVSSLQNCGCYRGLLAPVMARLSTVVLNHQLCSYQEAVEGRGEHVLCSLSTQLPDPSFSGPQLRVVFLTSTVPVGPDWATNAYFSCSVTNILEVIPRGQALSTGHLIPCIKSLSA